MAFFTSSSAALTAAFFLFLQINLCIDGRGQGQKLDDRDYLEVALNLEYIETEFFLHSALGKGLDDLYHGMSRGGPAPAGAQKAKLDPLIRDIIEQFAYQEVGHLKAIFNHTKGFPRPQLNLSASLFAEMMDTALGETLHPPFDPYANDINYLLASYAIPYVGINGYVGAAANLQNPTFKTLVASLLGVESGQDAVIRALLYQYNANIKFLSPGAWLYKKYTIAYFTDKISDLRNSLGNAGTSKDEGIVVPQGMGAEGKVTGNVLVGDQQSLAYGRPPNELFRILYMTGDEKQPGGFLPNGAQGKIAQSYIGGY